MYIEELPSSSSMFTVTTDGPLITATLSSGDTTSTVNDSGNSAISSLRITTGSQSCRPPRLPVKNGIEVADCGMKSSEPET